MNPAIRRLLIALGVLIGLVLAGSAGFYTLGHGRWMFGECVYMTVITLSTVGFGDITPVSRMARWLAAMEAMTGLLYMTVLIARLVSLYSSPESNDS